MSRLPARLMAGENIAAVLATLITLYPAFRFDHAPIDHREQAAGKHHPKPATPIPVI